VSVSFVACAEAGYLEAQVVLLCRSIRAHAGAHADAPVHVFSPRAGRGIGRDTEAALRELGVEHHDEPLNVHHADRPTVNKVVVSAWAEANLTTDTVVFVDSDSVFLREPAELDLDIGVAAALRPVDTKNVGSSGRFDRNDRYWRRMNQLCGATQSRFVETTAEDQRIRAYFNAGLVAARRDSGFLGDWQRCLDLILSADLLPPDGRWTFVDQLALAAAAARHDQIEVLSASYNYPLPKRSVLAPPWDTVPLDDLVHLHYHRWFAKPAFLSLLDPPVDVDGPAARWLAPHLPLEPVHDDPLRTFPPRRRMRQR
jgi:hypothetical protein